MRVDSRRSVVIQLLAIAAMLALSGCGQPAAPAPRKGNVAAQSSAAAMKSIGDYHVGAPLTDEECQGWAEEFVRAMTVGDSPVLAGLFDWSALLDRATSGIEAPDQLRTGFSKGATGSASKSIMQDLQRPVQAGGNYKMLHVRQDDERPRVVMRLLVPATGPSYHDFILARHSDGHVRGVDMYVYSTAESVCESIRRMYLQFVMEQNKSLLARISGKESLLVKHIQEIAKMGELIRANQGAEALRICEKLPPELQRDKMVIALRYVAAQNSTEADYLAVLNDVEEIAPDDGSMDLMMIDGYFLRKDYKRALRCVNRFDKSIGGDPFLDTMRANIYSQEGRHDKALEAIQRAVENEPDLVEVHWMLLTMQLGQQDFDAVVETINRMTDKFALVFGDLAEVPEYAEFVKSPQYADWLESKSDPGTTTDPE